MIPDELVERVKESADIVQIIGEYVPLKRVGADFRGPCPFHQGTHKNFSVSPNRNIYYCFVCHEGGDVFNFLRKRLGMEWPEAVRMVAARAGIEIPEYSRQREGPDPREPFWEINATAAEYFTKILWDDEVGAEARAYLERRQIDRETASKFNLGFSPREIGLLRTYMNTLGYDEARLLEAGLLVQREEASLPRPRFSGRLMFPIHDASARCVGFGGRLLGPGEPKYLNSSDSAVFSKGKLLYGLHWARGSIRKENKAIVVEGYFDVVRLTMAGVDNVIAPLGTALTEEQGALLKRYTKEVVLLYDSDSAGERATFRAGDVLVAQGMSVQVATLPPGEDPDTFVAKQGRAGIEELVGTAIDVFDKKIRILEQKGWFLDLTHRRRAIDHLLPTIRAASDPLTRDLYASRASEASGVRKETILKELESTRTRTRGQRVEPAPPDSAEYPGNGAAAPAETAPRRRAPIAGETAEKAILAALLRVPGMLDGIAEHLGEADFWVPEYRKIYSLLLASGGEASVTDIERDLPAEVVQALQSILEYGESITDVTKTVDDSVGRIETRALKREMRQIDSEMSVASSEEKDALLRKKWNRLTGKSQTMNEGE